MANLLIEIRTGSDPEYMLETLLVDRTWCVSDKLILERMTCFSEAFCVLVALGLKEMRLCS